MATATFGPARILDLVAVACLGAIASAAVGGLLLLPSPLGVLVPVAVALAAAAWLLR